MIKELRAMKLKKISTSALCYLILAAFFSVICMEVTYAKFHSHKVEVSPVNNLNVGDLNIIVEEESDASELVNDFHFTHVFGYFNLISVFIFIGLFSSFLIFVRFNLLFKLPIFLRYRVLRI